MQVINCFWQVGEKIGAWPYNDHTQIRGSLPPTLRRRMTPLGQQVLELFYTAVTGLERNIPWVIACRHGDQTRRARMLTSLADREMLSPTDFSMSVHNSLIGVFSIATENKYLNTALAGGEVSFEMGLLEAYALQKERGGTVGFMYYDIVKFQEADEGIECFAMLLDGSKRGMAISYLTDEQTKKDNKKVHKINSLAGFMNSEEKNYRLHVAGGHILLERNDH